MKAEYSDAHKQADRLWHKFQDVVDSPDAPAMQALGRQLKQIAEDIESDRNPRTIEDRIKQAQKALHTLRDQGETMMSYGDVDMLHDAYEALREDVRSLPDY